MQKESETNTFSRAEISLGNSRYSSLIYNCKSNPGMTGKITLATALFITTSFMASGQNTPTITAADYERASQRLGGNTSKLVDNLIKPEWLRDNRLWYQSLTENKSEFKLVNPADGSRITANSKKELFEKAGLPADEAKASAAVSPDGKYEVFIKDWNLWLREKTTGTEKALTTDGVKDFGYATDNAGWKHGDGPVVSWSPDSKKIATYQQDQRHVSNMYLVKTQVGEPELMEWKYPLPGDESIIKIHRLIIDISATPKITRFQMEPDDRRGSLSDDISQRGKLVDVEWSKDSQQLAFVSTSRDHKQAKVQIANAPTGEVNSLFEEISATQFESGQDAISWTYLSESNEIIWYSERSYWGHLYLYDATTGKIKNTITSGEFVVRKILHIDEKNRTIYFSGGGKEAGNPYYRYVYSVDFSGKKLKLLTPGEGDHVTTFSPNGKYFVDSYSTSSTPPVTEVRDTKGKLVTTLEKTSIARLEATGWKPPTPFTVKSASGEWDLYGFMHTPTQMNPSQKYPVIVYIYPGPQGGSVSSWGFSASSRDNQALAELGFVVVELEGSCNPQRSKSFHDACYGNMGENTLPDQIAGLKQLSSQYGFLDLDKVGIWGHSGGGFATAAAMFRYPDFFKVGISESGNHDNRGYEDDWGERYVGLEKMGENNITNYEAQANQIFAKDLKGKLLIAHGGMDDNVPPYNSYLVIDALIKANKDYDFILLPNARHGYGSDGYYMMRRRWDYFVTHLMKATPPKEFELKVAPDPRLAEEK